MKTFCRIFLLLITGRMQRVAAQMDPTFITDRWHITPDPVVCADNYWYNFTYGVSNYIDVGQVGFKIYSAPECRSDGGTDLTTSTGFIPTSIVNDVEPGSVTDPALTVKDAKSVEIPIHLDSSTVRQNEDVYTDLGPGQTQFRFCLVVIINRNDDVDDDSTGSSTPDSSSAEMTSIESIVTITVDLRDLDAGFVIPSIDLTPKEVFQNTAEKSYTANAYQCNGATGEVAIPDTPFQQGDAVTVCVKPDSTATADGFVMDTFNYLEYNLGSTTQIAIESGGEASSNGLTLYNKGTDCFIIDADAQTGQVKDSYCSANTILTASFFTSDGEVSVNGIAAFKFDDNRDRTRKVRDRILSPDERDRLENDYQYCFRLGRTRELQDEAQFSPFSLRIDVSKSTEDSRPSMLSIASVAVVPVTHIVFPLLCCSIVTTLLWI